MLPRMTKRRFHRQAIGIFVCLLCLLLTTGAVGPSAPAAPVRRQDWQLSSTPPAPAPPPITAAGAAAFFDAKIPAYLAQYQVPGATVAVVAGGQVIFSRGYGAARVDPNGGEAVPVDPQTTLFRVGSLTKLLTWTAVMQLVEAGKLDLHADVNQYLDFTLPPTYPAPVTLWHLLTHTAGFENRNFGYAAGANGAVQALAAWVPAHVPARVRPPGERAAYSNYGTVLAGYIVERAAGMPYADYVHTHILDPLGMRHASMAPTLPPALAEQVAYGYQSAGTPGAFVRAEPPQLQVAPAGALAATAEDMARFALAHLGHQPAGAPGTLLAPETLVMMHATAFRAASEPAGAADGAAPGGSRAMNGMALGFFELSRHGEHMIGHVGASLPSFHSLLVLLPARDAGFFVSFNGAGALPLTTGASAILLRDFTDAFVPDPLADTRLTPAGDPAAAAYAGSYRFANNPASSTTTVEKSAELLGGAVTVAVAPDGALHLHDAWGEKRLVAVGPGRFQEVDAGGRPGDDVLVFGTDAQGQVSGFALSSRSSQWFARLPWYATPAVGQALLLGCVVLFLGTLLGAAVGPLRRRTRRDPQEAPQKAPQNVPQSAVWARRLLLAAVGCSLLFVAAYAAVMLLAPQSIVAGETTLLAAVLALPVLGLALALACVGFTLAAWRGRWWSRWARVAYTAITAGLLLFAWVLSAWNLLGWRW